MICSLDCAVQLLRLSHNSLSIRPKVQAYSNAGGIQVPCTLLAYIVIYNRTSWCHYRPVKGHM